MRQRRSGRLAAAGLRAAALACLVFGAAEAAYAQGGCGAGGGGGGGGAGGGAAAGGTGTTAGTGAGVAVVGATGGTATGSAAVGAAEYATIDPAMMLAAGRQQAMVARQVHMAKISALRQKFHMIGEIKRAAELRREAEVRRGDALALATIRGR